MEDTETLIALVASRLIQNHRSYTHESIVDALILANGDPELAVTTLLASPESSTSKTSLKRKRVDLEGWLKKPTTSKGKLTAKLSLPESPSSADASRLTNLKLDSNKRTPRSPSSKPVDLMTILQPPPPQKISPTRLPPMTLSNPQMVAKYTPCTLHLSILPPELACRLFYTMIDASKSWKRNKWWLFDRVVESPHLTSFFARKPDGFDNDENWQEAAQYWYNGRMTEPPSEFPPEMEEACKIVEKVVNDEMRKRTKRFDLEWGANSEDPLWRANVAASNCYQGGKESVGPHSDQLTYLGPYPTIASLSLGTRRNFTLREVVPSDETTVRKAQTFTLPLAHNSLTIMHASCQERFKHSIPPQSPVDLFRPAYPRRHEGDLFGAIEPSNCRINITFRFYRPDFRPGSIPRCKCGVPTILRPDMKNRNNGETDRYWWTCYAGAQNNGKGCDFWNVMDMEAEGRGQWFASQRSDPR